MGHLREGATPTPNVGAPGVTGAQEPDPLPVVTAADAKMFGLENVSRVSIKYDRALTYANSVLQALYFCAPFRDLLVQYPDASQPDLTLTTSISPSPPPPTSPPTSPPQPHPLSPPNSIPSSPPTLLSALRSLYLHISRNPLEKGTVAPRAFIDKLKELNELFRSTMHQDAHEFLNYLLNQIVEEMDEMRKRGLDVSSQANGKENWGVNGIGPSTTEDLSSSITSLTSLPSSSHPPLPSQPQAHPLPSTTNAAHPPTNASTAFIQSTLVHLLFEGTLTSETRCLTCETVSSRDESFLDLSIDIEQNSSVTACLRGFSASEMLCQRNKFFCDACCDLQEAEKRMKIKKLPNILALHLKRFKYQEDLGKYIKLAYRVAFPLELRLFNTADGTSNPDRLYELFAIVVHIGSGPHHGHYVSIVKARGGTWYLFDDEKIDAIKETDIPRYFGDSNAGSAYVLYYQAADLDYGALGLRTEDKSKSEEASRREREGSEEKVEGTIGEEREGEEDVSVPSSTPASTSSPLPIPRPLPHPPGLPVQNHTQSSAEQIPQPPSTPTKPKRKASLKINMTRSPELAPSNSTSTATTSSAAPSTSSTTTLEPSPSLPLPSAPPTPSSTTRSFFNPLRHAPSLRIRPSSSSGAINRNSQSIFGNGDEPPVPPLPISVSPSLSGSGNGYGGKKGGRPATAGASPSSSSLEPIAPLPSASPSKEKEKDKGKEKSYERSVSLGSNGATDSTNANGKRVSRRASEVVLHHPHPHPHHQPPTTSPDHSVLRPVPENKRSSGGEVLLDEPAQAKRAVGSGLHRPRTAGGVLESERIREGVIADSSPPLPLPPLSLAKSEGGNAEHHSASMNGVANLFHQVESHLHHHPHPHGHARAESTSAMSPPPSSSNGLSSTPTLREFATSPSRRQSQRPKTAHAASPPSFTATNGTTSTLNTLGSSETNSSSSSSPAGNGNGNGSTGGKMKRASRKLSFTTAMLGFTRRDKEKEGKYRPLSPAHSQTSSQGAGKTG
ncbi:hypothetical protein BC629DRAFT_1582630 [Irpex lacteus]|nr:hypothetical protein BC629DRAFT_1582630 [Irpex lacteus]